MLWPILLSLIAIVAATAYQNVRKPSIHRQGEKLRYGFGTLPILGNATKFLQPRHLLLDWFVRCQRKFGFETFAISIPSLPSGVVINDPKNVEYVLKNESTITKGEFFRRRSWGLFGHGIINADGELWKTQRKAGLKFFTGSNLDTLIEDVLPNAYMETRSILRKRAESRQPLDLEAVLLDLTTTVVGRMAYDMDISATSPFSRAFDYASDRTGRRFQNPLYFITELFTGSRFRSSIAEVKRFGQEIVSNARTRRNERQQAQSSSDPTFGSLVDSLMDAFDDDPILTADAALNFLSAGRDTTAQSLTWTCYSLMRHPSALAMLREEILSVFASSSSSPPLHNFNQEKPLAPLLKLSVADLQPNNLPRTMSIFNESLRLYPPVPFEIKQCQADISLPDCTFLPNGSIIIWSIWAMNRSQAVWGDDSDSFRPERWLTTAATYGKGDDRPAKLITKSAFEFPVFNGGSRSCLGKKMAELMACWVLVQMSREFDFEEIFDTNEMTGGGKGGGKKERRSQNSLTLPMEGGLPCYVKLREEQSSVL